MSPKLDSWSARSSSVFSRSRTARKVTMASRRLRHSEMIREERHAAVAFDLAQQHLAPLRDVDHRARGIRSGGGVAAGRRCRAWERA